MYIVRLRKKDNKKAKSIKSVTPLSTVCLMFTSEYTYNIQN
jgi:hypothetical protein